MHCDLVSIALHIFFTMHIVLFTMNNVHVTFQLIISHMCIWQRLQIQQLLCNSLFTIRKPVRVQVLKIFGGAREVGDNN